MKIASLSAWVVKTDYTGEVWPAWSPGTRWQGTQATIYEIRTEDGLVGVGAGRGAPDVANDVVAPLIAGRDASHIEPIVRTIINGAGGWAAVPMACAIEMALWDLAGKRAGMPLYRLWGAHTDRIRAYASMVDRGYTAIKLRLHSETIREDIAQAEAVRAAVGDRMDIMVDANRAQEPGTPGAE